MKYITSIIIQLLLVAIISAQSDCFEADASIWLDTWVSCDKTPNPKSEYGDSHWIQYNFGSIRTLSKTWIWNTNDPNRLNQGFNHVKIDYSEDGQNWTYWGEMNFPKAQGDAIYSGFSGPDMVGIKAQYVLITALSNHGDSNCMGIAEIKFNLMLTPYDGEFPNTDNNDEECLAVEEYYIEELTSYEALIFWEWPADYDPEFLFEFWISGNEEGEEILTDEPEIFIEDLEPNTIYEFRIITLCEGDDNETLSDTWTFTTPDEGEFNCLAVEDIWVEDVSNTQAHIAWYSDEEIEEFIVEHGIKDEEERVEELVFESEIFLSNLEPMQHYELVVLFECGEELIYSEPIYFYTEGELTSLDDLSNDDNVDQQIAKLQPNPTQGQFFFEYFTNKRDVLNYSITDINGRVLMRNVSQLEKRNNIFNLDLTALPDGVYFLNTLTLEKRRRISKKIIKMAK